MTGRRCGAVPLNPPDRAVAPVRAAAPARARPSEPVDRGPPTIPAVPARAGTARRQRCCRRLLSPAPPTANRRPPLPVPTGRNGPRRPPGTPSSNHPVDPRWIRRPAPDGRTRAGRMLRPLARRRPEPRHPLPSRRIPLPPIWRLPARPPPAQGRPVRRPPVRGRWPRGRRARGRRARVRGPPLDPAAPGDRAAAPRSRRERFPGQVAPAPRPPRPRRGEAVPTAPVPTALVPTVASRIAASRIAVSRITAVPTAAAASAVPIGIGPARESPSGTARGRRCPHPGRLVPPTVGPVTRMWAPLPANSARPPYRRRRRPPARRRPGAPPGSPRDYPTPARSPRSNGHGRPTRSPWSVRPA